MTSAELHALATDIAGQIWQPEQCAVQGIWEGRTIHILGSGPSAAQFVMDIESLERGPNGGVKSNFAPVIACNAAIRLVPMADIWLTSERSVHLHDWFAAGAKCRGIPVMEVGITETDPVRPPVDPATFPDDFWRRVLWHKRFCLGYDDQQPYPLVWEHDFREPHGGLAVIQDQSTGIAEALGTVTSRALQIAMLAGASKVVFWGVELYFKDGRQYATDDVAYAGPDPHDAHTNGEISFVIRDGEPVEIGIEEQAIRYIDVEVSNAWSRQIIGHEEALLKHPPIYRTTRLMLHSSIALRAMLERCTEQGLEWEDRSGGLLEPEKLA